MGEVGEEWLVIANGDRNLKHSGQRPVGYVLIPLSSSSSSSTCGLHLNHVVLLIIISALYGLHLLIPSYQCRQRWSIFVMPSWDLAHCMFLLSGWWNIVWWSSSWATKLVVNFILDTENISTFIHTEAGQYTLYPAVSILETRAEQARMPIYTNHWVLDRYYLRDQTQMTLNHFYYNWKFE